MAQITKICDDAAMTTQVYPQTHERAVVDNNGTTAETKFQMITDLVNQKQMEIGAVPSDLTPTKDSINWATSGGIYKVLMQLGKECSIEQESETITEEGQQGQWQTSGSIGTSAAIRAHLKISAKGCSSLEVTAPSDYYFIAYEVYDNNASVVSLSSAWENSDTFQVSGDYDVMLNIKYGSAGTTNITTQMLTGKDFTIVKNYPSLAFESAAPYDEFTVLQESMEVVDNTLFSDGVEKTIDNSNAESENYKSYTGGNLTRGYLSVPVDEMNDYSVNILVKNNSPIKLALQGWATLGDFESYVYTSSWNLPDDSLTYSKNNPSIVELALVVTYIDGNTGVPTWSEFLQNIEFSITYTDANGLVRRVEVLEDGQMRRVEGLDFSEQLPTTTYYGDKIELLQNSYTFEQLGTLQSGVSSRQGGAVYGNYLFQFHDTLATICVYDLSSKQNVDKITMTAISNCHAGGGGFSKQYYDSGDPFPLLYISSGDEHKVYVFRITGTVGNLSATLIQTITLATPYYLTNIAVDNVNEKLVISSMTKNSWSDSSGNNVAMMTCDIPSYNADVTISAFENICLIPFIFALQGAFASFGKVYMAYGNAGSPYYNGGIIVYDYMNYNILNRVGVQAIGSIEPEACCQWGDKMILTTQDGKVYALVF